MGQDEPQRPDDMRRDSPQDLALDERFANQPKFKMFEIAEAAVDQLGRGA